jgi:hypothetical protein
MKKRLLLFLSLVAATAILNAQDQVEMVSSCALGIGENTTYLKDFVIKLPGSSDATNPPIYKANIYLMKNQNYRFTMCNEEAVQGELILELYDKTKLIISTHNAKSGSVANTFDFSCNKTGLYQLWYTFKEGHKGMGVGIVSLVK